MSPKQLIDLSQFDQASFVACYGGLYEHSPWIAENAWDSLENKHSTTIEGLGLTLQGVLKNASQESNLALLKAHPELAGKAATEGTLTADSTDEQASARLDLCTEAEFKRFHQLNALYKEKFDFPFILAVRNRNRTEILAAFEARLNNSAEDEFNNALEQVHQIALLRLIAIHESKSQSRAS